MATIAGVFANALTANQAVNELLEIGLGRDDMTLLMSEKTRGMFNSAASDQTGRIMGDAATGSIWGGVFGALIAGLTTVGSLVIPGVNLLMVGPLVAIVAGFGTGVVAGGMVGALVAAGLNEIDAHKYAAAIEAGKAVLVVHNVSDTNAGSIRSILSNLELRDQTKAA